LKLIFVIVMNDLQTLSFFNDQVWNPIYGIGIGKVILLIFVR